MGMGFMAVIVSDSAIWDNSKFHLHKLLAKKMGPMKVDSQGSIEENTLAIKTFLGSMNDLVVLLGN